MHKILKSSKAIKEIVLVLLHTPSESAPPHTPVSWRSVLMITACTTIVTPAFAASVYGYATGDFQPLKDIVQLMGEVVRFGLEWLKAPKPAG